MSTPAKFSFFLQESTSTDFEDVKIRMTKRSVTSVGLKVRRTLVVDPDWGTFCSVSLEELIQWMGGVQELLFSLERAVSMQVAAHLMRANDRRLRTVKKLIRQNAMISFLAFHLTDLPDHFIVDVSSGLSLAFNNAATVLPEDEDGNKSKQLRKAVLPATTIHTDAAWLVMGLPIVVSKNDVLNDIYRKESSHWDNVFFRSSACVLTMFDFRPSNSESEEKEATAVQQKQHQFQGMVTALKELAESSDRTSLVQFPLLNALLNEAEKLNDIEKSEELVDPIFTLRFFINAAQTIPEMPQRVHFLSRFQVAFTIALGVCSKVKNTYSRSNV